MRQKNESKKIIFHKKVSKSPTRFDKKFNITNDNIESKENIKPTVKINYRNSRKSNVINNNIKLPTESNDNNNNRISIKYNLKNTEKIFNKTNNNILHNENPRNSHIINEPSIYNGNGMETMAQYISDIKQSRKYLCRIYRQKGKSIMNKMQKLEFQKKAK